VDDVVAALVEQQAELLGLLGELDESDWQRPSRCEGWTVADVVLHVAQTNEMAIASARGRFAEFLTAVGREVGPGAVIRDRYRSGADELRELLSASNPHSRVEWVAGQLSARTLATTRLAETWIHTGDVAEALDVDLAPAPRLHHVARLAWRTLPYAFARDDRELHGPVAFNLRGPNGDAWDFVPDGGVLTTINGDGVELCLVAARRVDPANTSLAGTGPDVDAVLELVRTYA
jgi:uncharacterized protein (TIGR03084 family)